jgi:hypothetical protein
MSPRQWTGLRVAGGGVLLVLVCWRLGSGPVIDGLRTVDGCALALLATAVPAVTGLRRSEKGGRWLTARTPC